MTPPEALARLWTTPDPEDLVALQRLLLRAESDPIQRLAAQRGLEVAGEFHTYLSELRSKLGAREYSHVASLMDIGAVGAVALENVVEPGSRKALQILLGALSESLMVLASRQYVRAWGLELRPLAARAAWYLRAELWRLSQAAQPDLPADRRIDLIESLLSPAVDETTPSDAQHALIGRLFQIVLTLHVSDALAAGPDRAERGSGAGATPQPSG